MAIYTWKFYVNDEHTLVVDHPFKGNVVVRLDDKVIQESADHEMSYDFRVDEKPFNLEIKYEIQDFGIAKMQSWVHHLYMYSDGNWTEIQSAKE
jgi:hypothetical protein